MLVTVVAYSHKQQQHEASILHAVRLNMLGIWSISTACSMCKIMTACVLHDDSMSCFATACSDIDSMFIWTNMLSEYGVKCDIMQELRAILITLVTFVT
jgi:hypothetical protein